MPTDVDSDSGLECCCVFFKESHFLTLRDNSALTSIFFAYKKIYHLEAMSGMKNVDGADGGDHVDAKKVDTTK